MRGRLKSQSDPSSASIKETAEMQHARLARLFALTATSLALLGTLFAGSASAAPSPWWQLLDGSRPSHLWEGTDNVQEISTHLNGEFGEDAMAVKIKVEGDLIGCLATNNFIGGFLCENYVGEPLPVTETASQLEALLESAFGKNVEVSGGPVGGAPFIVTVAGEPAPVVEFSPTNFPLPVGTATNKLLSSGGSGRLLLTLTNLGDAPVDGSETPVTIKDQLPDGAVAAGAEAIGGVKDESGPVDCTVEAPDEVICTFEGTLPPYESIEVEVFTSLTGSPPDALGGA